MDKLKKVIEQYGRWSALKIYTDRIEMNIITDFSQALENAKAILETIGKEICKSKGVVLSKTSTFNGILNNAFKAIGYKNNELVIQISSALATIGQKMGDLRNEIGTTAHGRSLEELATRNDNVDVLTKEFLIDTTAIVACFLIRAFENESPRSVLPEETKIIYAENDVFNEFWDDTYGDFEMGEYSYPASEILYHVDYPAYSTEQRAFVESGEGDA